MKKNKNEIYMLLIIYTICIGRLVWIHGRIAGPIICIHYHSCIWNFFRRIFFVLRYTSYSLNKIQITVCVNNRPCFSSLG